MSKLDPSAFKVDGKSKFNLKKYPTKIKDIYANEDDYKKILRETADELDELQRMMYADNRYGVLVIFQALDAAGKDGTIRKVFSGVNPVGLNVVSFKQPSAVDLDHDFLWRTNLELPQRGTITIFNRSYYEEVLIVRVHPEILTESQKLPTELTKDVEKVWRHRYKDMANFEKYFSRNGFKIVKFFLNVSKKEQAVRLIDRINDPSKNWKFDENDVKEREYWDAYQQAFEECITHTARKKAPWYIVPADDEKNMRLITGKILLAEIKSLEMTYPVADSGRAKDLKKYIKMIEAQN